MKNIIDILSGDGDSEQQRANLNSALLIFRKIIHNQQLDPLEVDTIKKLCMATQKTNQQLLEEYLRYYLGLIKECTTKQQLDTLRVKILNEIRPLEDTVLSNTISRSVHKHALVIESELNQAISSVAAQDLISTVTQFMQNMPRDYDNIVNVIKNLFEYLQQLRDMMLKLQDRVLTPIEEIVAIEKVYKQTIDELQTFYDSLEMLDEEDIKALQDLQDGYIAYYTQLHSPLYQKYLYLANKQIIP